MIESALSNAAREVVNTMPQVHQLFSESQRRSFAEGEAKGKAEGEAKGKAEGEAKGKAEDDVRALVDALLLILAQRQLVVSLDQQHRIAECRDAAQLRRWLGSALVVASVAELVGAA